MVYKAELSLHTDFNNIIDYLCIPHNRFKIYRDLLDLEQETIYEDVTIERFVFGFQWPLMNRELVLALWQEIGDSEGAFVWRSTDYECLIRD